MHRDVEAADRTLMRLSDLLRLTLERLGEQEVTLAGELDFLRKYLEIEQTRFADRLIVRFDVSAETLDALGPDLLLQPLVENAIKHGVARKAGAGHIDITARRDGDKLLIEVRDDGVGLVGGRADGAAERHRRLDDAGAAAAPVRRRLPLRVPPAAAGLAVVVAIPWRTATRARRRRAVGTEPATNGRPDGRRLGAIARSTDSIGA